MSELKGMDRTTKCAFKGIPIPATQKAFLTSQAQDGRRLQYVVVQTPACVIMPPQNEVTFRTKGNKKNQFFNHNLMKQNPK